MRSLHLGLGLLVLVLAIQHAPTVALPGPQCQRKCGNVEIQYPFGIGLECSLAPYFNVSCEVQEDDVSKPFIFDDNVTELLDTSLTSSTIRVLNVISTYCYNTSGQMEDRSRVYDASDTPYRFSGIQNKFIVIGCNTLGYIADYSDNSSNSQSYLTGCLSTCCRLSDMTNGSCSGVGCCQTRIPRGMSTYQVGLQLAFPNSSWR